MNTALTRNRYPCFTALNLPAVRSPTTPAALRDFGPAFFPEAYRTSFFARIPCGTDASWASPFASKLAAASGRIEFVILPTSSSSPVALHPASRRRSYLRLSKPGLAPNEDFHLTDSLPSQAHWRDSGSQKMRLGDGSAGYPYPPASRVVAKATDHHGSRELA